MELIIYNDTLQDNLLIFVHKVFEENGISLNLADKHSDFLHPISSYLCFWTLVNDSKIIGCVGVKNYKKSERIVELKRLYLLRDYHGKGLGGKLIDTVIEYCIDHHYRRVRLDTKKRFKNAVFLIEKKGFKQIPRYNNSSADLFYELTL